MSKAEKDRKRKDAQRKLHHIKYDMVSMSTKLSKLDPSNPKHWSIISYLYDIITSAKFKLDDEILFSELDEVKIQEELIEEDLSPDLERDSLNAFNQNVEKSLDKLSDRERIAILSELPNMNFDQMLADQVLRHSQKGSSRNRKPINHENNKQD